jgi:hypothetical protein
MEGRNYEVLAGTDPAALTLVTNVNGKFPTSDIVLPSTNATRGFYQIRVK